MAKYKFKVRSGHHVARDDKGNRKMVGQGETFEADQPLHKGLFADKLSLVSMEGSKVDQEESTEQEVPATVEPVLSDTEKDDLGLADMTVADLKEYAEELELDASACKVKADYQNLIREALADE